jgi:hypothetical protein
MLLLLNINALFIDFLCGVDVLIDQRLVMIRLNSLPDLFQMLSDHLLLLHVGVGGLFQVVQLFLGLLQLGLEEFNIKLQFLILEVG